MHADTGFETRHDAGDVLATHRHGVAYAALVIDGSHVEASADGPIACTPGTLVLHPRWHAHGNRFGRTGTRVANLELDDDWDIAQLCALRVPDVREAARALAAGADVLRELIDACAPARTTSSMHAWQAQFLHGLQYGEHPVAELARRAGVSLAHASRSFAVSHGMSPQLLRRELRCRHALSLLSGDIALAEVAAMAGFSDQSHLHRTVRATTGSTPAALRRQLRARQIKCVQDAQAPAQLQ